MSLIEDQNIRQRKGASTKLGCPFYVSFTETSAAGKYRCSGIHSQHICNRDITSLEQYPQYRGTQNPAVQDQAAILTRRDVRASMAAGIIRDQFPGVLTQRADVHRMNQTRKEKQQSLSDVGLATSDIQELITEIRNHQDRYSVKFRGDTQVVDCLLYWNPADIELSRRFCQICYIHSMLIFRLSRWIQPTKTTTRSSHCWRSLRLRMR